MAEKILNNLELFSPITLTELNAKASYLQRIDRKFLLTAKELSEILEELKEHFQALEICWKKIFSYDNIYMDTQEYLFYQQHQNKEKSRTKVRTRKYIDADKAFFEYKQKENWVTSKYRYEFPSEEHGIMTKWKKRFFEWVYQSMYRVTESPKITPSMNTQYKRITLVWKWWWERLTIDFDIKTQDLRDPDAKLVDLKNLVIIESKSLSEECFSCEIMKKNNIAKAKSCSKYSLWIVYAWLAKKYSTFSDTMEKIAKIKGEIKK